MSDKKELSAEVFGTVPHDLSYLHSIKLNRVPIDIIENPKRTFDTQRKRVDYDAIYYKLLNRVPKYYYRYEENFRNEFTYNTELPDYNTAEWEDMRADCERIVHSIAPEVNVPEKAFISPVLCGRHLKWLRGDEDYSIIWYPEIDYSNGPSIGIEIEQTPDYADMEWLSKVDRLWRFGIPVYEDGDREIAVPPTQDPKLLKDVYDTLERYGYIVDRNPNIHVSIGGLEDAGLYDLLFMNLVLSCTAGNSFRATSPNVHNYLDIRSISGVSSKVIDDSFWDADTYDYQVRRRCNGSVELRSLFWPTTDTVRIKQGIDSVYKVATSLKNYLDGNKESWLGFVNDMSVELASALGVSPETLSRHLQAHVFRIRVAHATFLEEDPDAKDQSDLIDSWKKDTLALSNDMQTSYSGLAYSTLCGILGTIAFDDNQFLGTRIQSVINRLPT